MPRDGSGVYSAPAGTTVTTGTTIESAPYNAFVADLVSDANTVRPVVAGGTGVSTVGAAQTAFKIPAYDGTPTISGNWTVTGSWTQSGTYTLNGATPLLIQASVGNSVTIGTSVDNGNDSELIFRKARGGGTPAQITAGDDLGTIRFRGYNGSAYADGVVIAADSTTNTSNFGGVLKVTTNGTLALTIDENQDATFAGDVSADTFSGAGVSTDISADTGSTTKVPNVDAVETAIAAAQTTWAVDSDRIISAASTYTWAHGLGAVPKVIQAELVCQTGEFNYTAGQVIQVPIGVDASSRGISIIKDATNIVVRMGSGAAIMAYPNATTGAGSALTYANWKLRLRAAI